MLSNVCFSLCRWADSGPKLGSRLTSSALAMKMAATAMATRRWIDGFVFPSLKKQFVSFALFYGYQSLQSLHGKSSCIVQFSEVRGLLAACLWIQAGSQVQLHSSSAMEPWTNGSCDCLLGQRPHRKGACQCFTGPADWSF